MNKEEIKKLDQEKIVGTYSRYDMVADHGKEQWTSYRRKGIYHSS